MQAPRLCIACRSRRPVGGGEVSLLAAAGPRGRWAAARRSASKRTPSRPARAHRPTGPPGGPRRSFPSWTSPVRPGSPALFGSPCAIRGFRWRSTTRIRRERLSRCARRPGGGHVFSENPPRGLVDVYAAVIPTSRSAAPSSSTRPRKDSPKEMGRSGETLPECSGSESQESRSDALDGGHEGIVIRSGPHGRRFVVDQVARIRGERPGQLLGLDKPYPLGREELDDGGTVRSTEP